MKSTDDNIIAAKTKQFAIRIIRLSNFLREEKKEYVLSKQILRSGTSIGANVREGIRGQTDPDFYSKMSIALKETEETGYWLELLHETDYLNDDEFDSLYSDYLEIARILMAITKTQKTKNTK